MQAIILAGGQGTRLKPFTNVIPKPLVPLGDMPILEIILRQLSQKGVTRVTLAVNHLARLIEAFFQDGTDLGLQIQYSLEDRPLGTAAPLLNVPDLADHFFIMNGDVLTTIDYRALYDFHLRQDNALTIATFTREVKIDLGVLEIDGNRLTGYIEKPQHTFDVSMGIYVCSKDATRYIPPNTPFDMPQFAKALLSADERVGCYRGKYEWLDIGRVDDYETAVEMFERRRSDFLGG